jgi:hypothetical protein
MASPERFLSFGVGRRTSSPRSRQAAKRHLVPMDVNSDERLDIASREIYRWRNNKPTGREM